MSVPDELRYSSDHEWISIDGLQARIGITDYAQDALGDVVYVEVPSVGAAVTAGEAMSEVEVISARHREYACSACNTEIPFAVYAKLMGDGATAVQCVSCKRILHMPAEAEATAAKKR